MERSLGEMGVYHHLVIRCGKQKPGEFKQIWEVEHFLLGK